MKRCWFHTLLFLLGIIGFPACEVHSPEATGAREVALNELKMTEGAQACVASEDFLVLDLPYGVALGKIDKVLVDGKRIYVGDYLTQRVFAFGADGKLEAVLDRRGRGPGEYLQMQGFSVGGGRIYVLDQFESTVLAYDAASLEFRGAEKAPAPAWDFAALRDGGFLFAYAPMEGTPVRDPSLQYRVIVTDSKMHIRERHFPYEKDEADAITVQQYLSECGDAVLYGSFRQDGYCRFDRQDGSLLERVDFQFARPVPSGDKASLPAIMEGKYTWQTRVPYLGKGYCALSLSVEGMGQTCVYDIHKGQLLCQQKGTMSHALLGIVGSDGSRLIGSWQDKSIYEFLTRSGFKRAAPAAEAAILDDKPFLVFYQMNK